MEAKIMKITTTLSMRERLATNFLGKIACTKVLLRAMEKGFTVFRPEVECRCDRIIDDGAKLHRVQIKYAGAKCPKQVSGIVPVGLKKWRTDGRPPILYYTTEE